MTDISKMGIKDLVKNLGKVEKFTSGSVFNNELFEKELEIVCEKNKSKFDSNIVRVIKENT